LTRLGSCHSSRGKRSSPAAITAFHQRGMGDQKLQSGSERVRASSKTHALWCVTRVHQWLRPKRALARARPRRDTVLAGQIDQLRVRGQPLIALRQVSQFSDRKDQHSRLTFSGFICPRITCAFKNFLIFATANNLLPHWGGESNFRACDSDNEER